jgi:hypothetical protein
MSCTGSGTRGRPGLFYGEMQQNQWILRLLSTDIKLQTILLGQTQTRQRHESSTNEFQQFFGYLVWLFLLWPVSSAFNEGDALELCTSLVHVL